MALQFYWNSSAATPYRTTTFNQTDGIRTNTVTLPTANTSITGTQPIRITEAAVYLAGYGTGASGAGTAAVRVGGNNSSFFTITKKATTNTVGADYTGFWSVGGANGVNYDRSTQTTGTMGFDAPGDVFFGRWGTTADSTTIWGVCNYILVPVPPAPSGTSVGSNSFVVTHSGGSDGGGTISSVTIEVSTSSAFSSYEAFNSGSTVTSINGSPITSSTTYYLRAYQTNELGSSRRTTGTYTVTTTTPTYPSPPTSFSATTNRTDGTLLSWSGASGTITSYGIWWGSQPSSSSSPDFTVSTSATSGSFLDDVISEGSGRYYWIRSQNNVGPSDWFPASSAGVYGFRVGSTTYTTTFNPQGGTFFDGVTGNNLSLRDLLVHL